MAGHRRHAGWAARAGFSLVELLVVLAILGLLAGLLFPVFATARDRARQAVCISNLRQIGLAMDAYTADYDGGRPKRRLAQVLPWLGSTAVLTCQADPLLRDGGWARAWAVFWRPEPVLPAESYFYFGLPDRLYACLAANPTMGYCVDVLHGTRVGPDYRDSFEIPPLYQGRFLRLRPDGSVVTAHASWEPVGSYSDWGYMTGQRMPGPLDCD